jgi:hypothetical protein
MRLQFVSRENGPERLVCEAEVVFDEPSPHEGMNRLGFSLWRGPDGEVFVTLPSRSFGVGNDRRYFDLLRSVDGQAADGKRVKGWVLEEYQAATHPS